MDVSNYKVGDCKKMCVSEKIDFLHKVHTEEISLWDDDGNDNEIWNDYHMVQDEFLQHAELLHCEDVLHIMKIFDDDCFEISWQFHLAVMLYRNCVHYGTNRIAFYLQHLQEIPSNGRFHGWHFPIQWLMDEKSFLLLKEAVQEQTAETKKLVSQILDGIETHPEEKEQLRALLDT
ncbi:MAG: hypothetical protein HFI39_01915 [Lachnospiraceae bacterium]|nr:hypothetical protein [Lachnospiraceae bacterium]